VVLPQFQQVFEFLDAIAKAASDAGDTGIFDDSVSRGGARERERGLVSGKTFFHQCRDDASTLGVW
jgi:hypothetical protein